jgi:hypothetical protein
VKLARFVSKAPLAGQRPILQDKTIDLMLHSKDPSVPDNLLRLGWANFEHEGYGLIHASGGMPGAASRLAIVPEARLISVVVSNALTPDLWEIEKTVFAAYLPGYAERTKVRRAEQPVASRRFAPPASLAGVWTGTVKTHEGDVPVRLEITDGGGVRFALGGRVLPVIQIPPAIADWRLSFENGFFTAPLGGSLRNSDTARAPHILYAVLRLRQDRLTGCLLAAAMNMRFVLPYWTELHRGS